MDCHLLDVHHFGSISSSDVLIRSGRRKCVVLTSQPSRAYELRYKDTGLKRGVRKTFIWVKSRSPSQRPVYMRRTMDDICRVRCVYCLGFILLVVSVYRLFDFPLQVDKRRD